MVAASDGQSARAVPAEVNFGATQPNGRTALPPHANK